MITLEELEKQIGITRDRACKILGNPEVITLNEDFKKACKLGLLSIRALQQPKEGHVKPQGH